MINALDCEYNDIYVHIDKKVTGLEFKELYRCVQISTLNVYQEIDVRWGGYSQVEVELFLLKNAISGNYVYYHLMSGSDLPIKNQKYIYNYFQENNGVEYVDFDKNILSEKIEIRIKYYYIFTDWKRSKNKIIRILKKSTLFTFIYLQKILNFKNLNEKQIYKKGSQWFSITHKCALFVLKNEDRIEHIYKYGCCVDEIFLQTLIYNSKFYKQIYSTNEKYNLAMRYIDWNHGEPYVFRKTDFRRLQNSKALFARKFDENIDGEIIDLICQYIEVE